MRFVRSIRDTAAGDGDRRNVGRPDGDDRQSARVVACDGKDVRDGTHGANGIGRVAASREFVAYLRQLVADRRKNPSDDLISRLVEVEEAGEKLTEDELIANCILLLNAGHEATVNLIGNGMCALLKHPDQIGRWRADSSLTETAVEELLRYDTPLHQFNRWVLEPFEFRGQQFEVGQEIALLLGSANRDGDVFDSPSELDLGRKKNPHVSLGGGIHYCLGAPLARLELSIAFSVLIERLPQMELVAEPKYCNSFHFHGLESLIVRV